MSFVAGICGEDSEEDTPPKHAHAFGNSARLHKQVYDERGAALSEFDGEVAKKKFPYADPNINMYGSEKENSLRRWIRNNQKTNADLVRSYTVRPAQPPRPGRSVTIIFRSAGNSPTWDVLYHRKYLGDCQALTSLKPSTSKRP